jgi:hypothetical protein
MKRPYGDEDLGMLTAQWRSIPEFLGKIVIALVLVNVYYILKCENYY